MRRLPMTNKNRLCRISIDVAPDIHKRLKAKAVEVEKSIREIVMEFLEDYLRTDTIPKP
jgi:hypothetical protein